jgi:antitoxin VapB
VVALNIKDPKTDQFARSLARITGESLTEAINKALRARLEQETRRRGKSIDRTKINKIIERITSQSILDNRSPDQIIGYDEQGLPR